MCVLILPSRCNCVNNYMFSMYISNMQPQEVEVFPLLGELFPLGTNTVNSSPTIFCRIISQGCKVCLDIIVFFLPQIPSLSWCTQSVSYFSLQTPALNISGLCLELVEVLGSASLGVACQRSEIGDPASPGQPSFTSALAGPVKHTLWSLFWLSFRSRVWSGWAFVQ